MLVLASVSHSAVFLFAIPWTVACQAPLSMGFSRQESWSGLPCPSPGDLPNPGIKSRSPTLQDDSLPTEPPGKQPYIYISNMFTYIYTHTHTHIYVVDIRRVDSLEKTDAWRDWGQEQKGMTDDEMAGWHLELDGCESE